ncbi:hypothetical protein GLOIN_2v1842993 [Rhizophagus clarus]|uniref:Ion transport domain-containing protein n=1 Tax=Rhizophagus clarus TaxID=94130 RepID=A0A8H3L7P2_9GLOM|nr:hypothetical protein GLOIN_2v1842993 [Rhizophagus clarus]
MNETQINTFASETKIDISDNTKEEIEKISSETKDDIFVVKSEKHRKSIDRIIVSQYINEGYDSDDYVVTYSREDKSILGWSVDIKKNGPQQPDVYFKVDQIDYLHKCLDIVLSKKILSLCGYNKYWLIDLNSDRTSNERFLKLKHPVSCKDDAYQSIGCDAIGFLPNGDLIQVSVRDRKIYKYCLKDKNIVPWGYSQINDIEIPENFYDEVKFFCSSICRTKLFLIVISYKTLILQFDLLKMKLERQYISCYSLQSMVVMNKNQTLLACNNCIFSMENGMLISDKNNGERPVEFITLKNNSERLIINCYSNHKLVDPHQVYDEIDISGDFNKTSVIITSNKKIFINNDYVYVANGLDENNLQQSSNQIIYRNSIYSLSTYKIIQSMLNEIISQNEIKKVVVGEKIVLKEEGKVKNKGLYEIILRPKDTYDLICFEQNNIIKKSYSIPHILSFKRLNSNQDFILISMEAIEICTLDEDFRSRYFWNNNEWNDIYKKFVEDYGLIYDINKHYKPLIERILKYEFNDSKYSIPLPNIMGQFIDHRKDIAEDVINDNLVSSKFGIEIRKIAIEESCDVVVRPIINNTIESVQDYSVNSMDFISLNLLKLCDDYPDHIIKYISYTSIILSPHCKRIGNSKNNSIHSYTNIYIKESHMDNNYFKSISVKYKGLIRYLRYISAIYLRIEEKIQTVSFIVPFPQICVYQDDSNNNDHEIETNDHENENNDIKSKIFTVLKKMITGIKIAIMIPRSNSIWNEFLYKPKSILFSNIDSNHFYNWWNFAAIIDFKWETFGKFYYYLIWLFYTILYTCYSLASTLKQNSISDFYFELLFIISIIFGSIFLIFEIRQCLWNYKIYFNDIWNLFVLGYAQAFFIVLRSNNINDDNDPRNVATKYDFVNPDGTISNATTMIQDPDTNTNLFNWFPTSLLAVYKLLTGDSGSLSSFTYHEHSIMTILLVTFTFFTVIYLMNLFIGLLNIAIDDYNKKEEFLLQKAQIIMEIELFYMLPCQRNNKKWFPNWIYYDIPVTEIRKLINAIDNKQTVFNYPPFINEKLRELVVLTDDNKKQDNKEEQDNDKKQVIKEEQNSKIEKKAYQIKEEFTQSNVELKQQMNKLEQQMESIIKYIGIEQDNKEKKDNKLEMQIEQTKEELPKQNIELKQQMDKLEQKLESIMELLSKIN